MMMMMMIMRCVAFFACLIRTVNARTPLPPTTYIKETQDTPPPTHGPTTYQPTYLEETSSLQKLDAADDITTLAPTEAPTTYQPTYVQDISDTPAPTEAPTTYQPTYVQDISDTPAPTEAPHSSLQKLETADDITTSTTPAPTGAPTAFPTKTTTQVLNNNPPLQRCPGDVKVLMTKGATEYPSGSVVEGVVDADSKVLPMLPAVSISAQDTQTVTVALRNAWGAPVDAIYYNFIPGDKPHRFGAKCFGNDNVGADEVFDTISIQCTVATARAYLEVCVVDNLEHRTLLEGDAATIPKCCHSEESIAPEDDTSTSTSTTTTAVVCYHLEIKCNESSSSDCATTTAAAADDAPNLQRSLRGSSARPAF